MRYRRLGKTGWNVSAVSMGCWGIGGQWGPVAEDEAIHTIRRARELDVRVRRQRGDHGGGGATESDHAHAQRQRVAFRWKCSISVSSIVAPISSNARSSPVRATIASPTGAVPGSYAGSESAQPSITFTMLGLRRTSALARPNASRSASSASGRATMGTVGHKSAS